MNFAWPWRLRSQHAREEEDARKRREEVATKRANCPHDDFYIYSSNSARPMLCATCTKCGGEYGLDDLINRWKARLEREVQEAIHQARGC